MARPSPVAADGFVVTSNSWPAPPVASTTGRRLELVAPAGVADRDAVTRAVLDEQVHRDGVLTDLRDGPLRRGDQGALHLRAGCRAAGVKDARVGVPALARALQGAGRLAVEDRAECDQLLDARRPLVDEHPDRVHVAQPRTRSERVGEVQVRRVLVVVQHRGDAALRPARRRLRQRRLRHDADLDAGVGEPDGDGQPGDAAADDERVEAHVSAPTTASTLSMSRTPSTSPATRSRSVAPGVGLGRCAQRRGLHGRSVGQGDARLGGDDGAHLGERAIDAAAVARGLGGPRSSASGSASAAARPAALSRALRLDSASPSGSRTIGQPTTVDGQREVGDEPAHDAELLVVLLTEVRGAGARGDEQLGDDRRHPVEVARSAVPLEAVGEARDVHRRRRRRRPRRPHLFDGGSEDQLDAARRGERRRPRRGRAGRRRGRRRRRTGAG